MRKTDLELATYELGGAIATLTRIHDQITEAAPVKPRSLPDEFRDRGYRVEILDGTHDGVGNAYVRVLDPNGKAILDGRDHVSADASAWINGFVAGHDRAQRPQ